MFLRAGVTAAMLAVAVSVTGGAQAANQSVMALSGPNRFAPADVTVNQGEKVTWTNGSGNHNVVLDEGNTQLNAPSTSSWTVERTFTAVGTVRYYCEVHGGPNGMGMSGIVTVVAAPGGGSPPPPGGTPPGGPPPEGNPPGGSPGGNPPGGGGPGSGLPLLTVSLKASDTTPLAGHRVRLFGVVRPARDGRKVQIQKRVRNGEFKTIATTRLKDAGAAKSEFSLRLRVAGDAVLRARVAGDDERGTGVSKARKLDVHGARRG
jgi:plastocyanin